MRKLYLLFFLIFTSYICFAQHEQDTIREFLDFQGEICHPNLAYLYRMGIKIPGGWSVKDYYVYEKTLEETGNYLDDSFKVKEGPFTTYYPDGHIKEICNYHNDKLLGLDRKYSKDGTLSDSTFYINDIPCRYAYRWRTDGTCIGKGVFDDSGKGREWLYWGKDSLMDYKVFSTGHKRDSIWTYYYRNGKISCQEYYDKGNLKNRICYDKKGKIQNECDSSIMPSYVGGFSYYLAGAVHFPDNYTVKNEVRIVARFVVNPNGHTSDVEILQKINPAFDNEVKNAIIHSPKWYPGIDHNRKVKVFYKIPVVFEPN